MLFAIVTAFLGGVILNLMPCVFPIISLKAFGLVRQGGDPQRLRQEGVAFLAGTMLAMLVLAGILIALRAGGAAVGWGFQLQSPVVVALLILIMTGAGLNLSGLFEFGLGLQRIGQQFDGRDGRLGAALTGALAVVVATPCAGPLMAGAIGYALVQPPLVGLAIFAALGAGVAAPFTLLSFSPSLARHLPRPGPWMGTLKQLLAFPMFGTAAWLAWVLAQQVGPSGLALILGCIVFLGFLCWLYGLAQQRAIMGRPARALHLAVMAGVIAIGTAIAVPGGALGDPADTGPQIDMAKAEAYVRPIPWSPAKVAQAQAAGQAVFVDFSASWCLTCQVNEKAVLSRQPFRQAVARTNTAYMVADSTNYDPAIEKAMADLGRSGLPLYLVYPANGGAPTVLPQLLSSDMIVAALDTAAGRKG
ncbi:protein-disulfide reductase DsbD family protein [Sphingobium sp. YR768]|jgi:thiol:disulfide interchange protein DsbD|uniref:protein-disulfide reductase DsbD family protein n=1 Tax=Sphingobium sp. YR768 TaxID=1884365 RepID=UPI0008C6B2F6|nr:thioredoxin family protein [Sphingobium sp. YR768]SES09796.1 Thiol:disulfide interchange protein DsbD [Sphingobium sp. YR768]